jgi:hypothetical protein
MTVGPFFLREEAGTINNLKYPRTITSSFWCQRERNGKQNRRIADYLNLEKVVRIKWQITMARPTGSCDAATPQSW